ncbi:MAG: hypothetical protein ACLTR6_09215 [Clostridium fessum]
MIRCEKAQRAAVLALLAESFTLMNCRQPFFWFVIVMAGISGKKKDTEYSKMDQGHFRERSTPELLNEYLQILMYD